MSKEIVIKFNFDQELFESKENKNFTGALGISLEEFQKDFEEIASKNLSIVGAISHVLMHETLPDIHKILMMFEIGYKTGEQMTLDALNRQKEEMQMKQMKNLTPEFFKRVD